MAILICHIQGDSREKVNIMRDYIIDNCEKNSSYEHESNSA
jgi:hypothetical protein